MDASADVFRILDDVASEPMPTGALSLDDAYVHALERVEALAANQSGVDKTWVETALHEFRIHYARAERVR